MSEALVDSLLPDLGACGAFSAGPVSIGADRILRIQGYSDLERIRPRIRTAAEFSARLAGDLTAGQVGFRRIAIEQVADGVLRLDGGYTFQSEAFDKFLGGCDSVVAFVLTAGEAFDASIDEMMRGDQPVKGLFLDSAGWLAVEAVTRQFAEALKRDCAARGLRLTRRLGPGYSYRIDTRMEPWDLTEQRILFDALGNAPLPSRLLESSAMHPKMSRSGLYGIRAAATT